MKKKMRSKRGQFYIIAAIIIVIIISSIASTVTYTILKPEPKTIKELSAELKQEYPYVIEYGLYSQTDLGELLGNFTQKDFAKYYSEKSGDSKVVLIYGGKDGNITVVTYDKTSLGSVSAGGYSSDITDYFVNVTKMTIINNAQYTTVTIGNQTYTFNLGNNQNFYFIMNQTRGGEVYVETNR